MWSTDTRRISVPPVSGEPDVPVAILNHIVDLPCQPISGTELVPSPGIKERIGRGDLERVHGVGWNCPQQDSPYAEATEQTEDVEVGAHGNQDRDGNGTTARRASRTRRCPADVYMIDGASGDHV